MTNIAIFASGNGSNYQAIADAINDGKIKNANIELVVIDKANAYAIERAKKLGHKILVFDPKNFTNKTEYEKMICSEMLKLDINLVVLAGYMRLIGEYMLDRYEGKIINIHPSLLPSFKGKDAIKQAFDYPVKYTGVTVHYVDKTMDGGKIIDQHICKIENHDTLESLETKIHKIEHELFPKVISEIVRGNI